MSQAAQVSADHPSPKRRVIARRTLFFGLAAAPLAWAAQLIINYIIASNRCAALGEGQTLTGPAWAGMIATDAVAIAISLTAAALAWRSWRRTKGESAGEEDALVEIGEGRSRFMAMAGMMASFGFVGATLAVGAALFVVPLCAG